MLWGLGCYSLGFKVLDLRFQELDHSISAYRLFQAHAHLACASSEGSAVGATFAACGVGVTCATCFWDFGVRCVRV